MFNIVEKNQKLVKGIMITVAASFVVWGIGGYLNTMGDDGYVAKVGSKKIYSQDIDNAINSNPNQSQDKTQVLFGLINRQLLINSLQSHNMAVTTEQLQKAIATLPIFETNGQFDVTKYQEFLRKQYITSTKFEDNIREQLMLEQMVNFFRDSYFTSHSFQNKFTELLARKRNVLSYVIDPQQFYTKINIAESDINNYYQQNIAKFTIPEQVKLQYIKVSADDLASTIHISDDIINKYLQDHPELADNAEVDVSHILIAVASNATTSQKATAYAQAQKILVQVEANPSKFAELAKQYSQDAASASRGGDLGYFGRGVMTKPFESVAFALKPGQISGIVETQFGYHILKLNAQKNTDTQSLRQAALAKLQKQQAQQKLQPIVDELNDISYNHPDSLAPIASKTSLTVQTSDWLVKGGSGLLANNNLVNAIFTDDVLKNHHNSEVVDMGDGSFVVARVLDYKPSTVKPLASVKEQIVATLKLNQATQMAASQGQQDITMLQSGKITLNFANQIVVSLLDTSDKVDPQALQQIFKANKPFPAYTGAPTRDGGFVVYKISSEIANNAPNAKDKQIVEQMMGQYAMINLNAYVASLRSQYDVSYRLDRLKTDSANQSNN